MATLYGPEIVQHRRFYGAFVDVLAGIGYRGGDEEGANEVVNFYCPDDWICRV